MSLTMRDVREIKKQTLPTVVDANGKMVSVETLCEIIERQQSALEKYADEDNWDGPEFWFEGSDTRYKLALEALLPEGDHKIRNKQREER